MNRRRPSYWSVLSLCWLLGGCPAPSVPDAASSAERSSAGPVGEAVVSSGTRAGATAPAGDQRDLVLIIKPAAGALPDAVLRAGDGQAAAPWLSSIADLLGLPVRLVSVTSGQELLVVVDTAGGPPHSVQQVLDKLAAHPEVEYAQVDHQVVPFP